LFFCLLIDECMEILSLLNTVLTKQEHSKFSNPSDLEKLTKKLSLCYTNLLILKQTQFPDLKRKPWIIDWFTIKKRGDLSLFGLGIGRIKIDYLFWLRFQFQGKSTIVIDQTKISLVFFRYLHDRTVSLSLHTIPNEIRKG